jgi:hypothetical protein
MGTAISFLYYLRYIAIISLIISIFPIAKAIGFKRVNDIYPIYESTLTKNKILSVEIENQFYYENEILKQFYPSEFEKLQILTERLKTKEELYGFLHLENSKTLSIKLVEIEHFPTDTIISYKVISRQFPIIEKEIGLIQSNIIYR